MTVHTVIESFAAYESVRAADPSGARVWWTTSPFLLQKLPGLGESVRSPEEGLAQAEFDALARAARDFGDGFCAWYQANCAWARFVHFRFVLALQLTRLAFVLLYKAKLLSRIVAAAGPEPVVCVGNPRAPALESFALNFGRIDTVFAMLAGKLASVGVRVVQHELPPGEASQLETRIRHRRLEGVEKVLSLINNTWGSLLFKAWKHLHRRGVMPRRGISLRPFLAGRTLWVHKECELIQEATAGLLMGGVRLAFLPSLPRIDLGGAEVLGPPDGDAVALRLSQGMREALDAHAVSWLPEFGAALELTVDRCLAFLGILYRNLDALVLGFEKTLAGVRPGDEILSNALTSPLEGAFYGYCSWRRTPVCAFDHGVTLGLSEWSLSEARQAGMLAADRAFYHCSRAIEAVRLHAPGQEMHAVGLPRVTARPLVRGLQRRLGRQLLGIAPDQHVVMIVPDLERNNFIYGPSQDNDLQFMQKTRDITMTLCKAFPRSVVILKLYPTQRYADTYDFSDLVAEHSNLRIVGDIDFRFVRFAADLSVTASTQSTLGWVDGSGMPYVFLDFEWTPSVIEGLRLGLPSVPGLRAAVLPDRGAACLQEPIGAVRAILKAGV